jgi:hypothetical protein
MVSEAEAQGVRENKAAAHALRSNVYLSIPSATRSFPTANSGTCRSEGRCCTKGLKTNRLEIALLPSQEMLPEARKDRHGNHVVPGRCTSTMTAPPGAGVDRDRRPPSILQMLIAGRFRFVEMRGRRFRYRQTLCNSFGIEMKLNPG